MKGTNLVSWLYNYITTFLYYFSRLFDTNHQRYTDWKCRPKDTSSQQVKAVKATKPTDQDSVTECVTAYEVVDVVTSSSTGLFPKRKGQIRGAREQCVTGGGQRYRSLSDPALPLSHYNIDVPDYTVVMYYLYLPAWLALKSNMKMIRSSALVEQAHAHPTNKLTPTYNWKLLHR